MNNRIFTIIFFLIFAGCSKFNKAEYIRKDLAERPRLIRTIFSGNDDYLTLNCIREKDYHLKSILNDKDNLISRYLGLNSKEELKTVRDLDENFKWDQDNVQHKKILTEEEVRVFQEETDSDFLDFRNLPKCPEGYLTISKPVFNKSFDKAIVHIGQVCGFLCGSGEYRLYELKNGVWKLEEVVTRWVS